MWLKLLRHWKAFVAVAVVLSLGWFIALPFVKFPLSHQESRQILWLIRSGAFSDVPAHEEGGRYQLAARSDVIVLHARPFVCPTTGCPFRWFTAPRSGGPIELFTDGRKIQKKRFYVTSECADRKGRRWFLFNDGTVALLEDSAVDWDSQEIKIALPEKQ